MLEELKEQVFRANLDLVRHGLVIFTWGNVSAIDRASGLVVIKPSGVDYDRMKASDMVVVDLDGKVVEGDLRPSSDTPTHLVLYRAFPEVGGVVHTHSTYATAWARGRARHPEYRNHPRRLLPRSHSLYARHDRDRGRGRLRGGDRQRHRSPLRGLNPAHTPGVLVKNHGPFAWGRDAADAVHNAVVMEQWPRWLTLLMVSIRI